MTLSKSVDADFADIVIDSLTVKITYDYTDRKDGMYYIDVATNEGLMPYIACTDSKGKSGGYGQLHKAYSSSRPVTFTAISQYASFYFKNWTDRAGNVVSSQADLTVNKNSDQFYIANYEYRGPELSVPDTIIISNNGGSYMVSVRNIGKEYDEMEWYVSDSLSTFAHLDGVKEGVDDGTFTLTCEPNPTGERRVDTIEILAPEAYTTMKTIYIVQMDEPVEVTDISKLSNTVYINPVATSKGCTTSLNIRMKNKAAIRGFQFDLYLPEGVSVVKNKKGRIQGSLCEARLPEDDEHTLTVAEQANGSIRFLCGSQYDETFVGTDGDIVSLSVNIADDMTDGDYPIAIKDIKLTETDISKFYVTACVNSKLTVSSYMPGDINGDGKVDVSDYIGVANHIMGNTPAGFNSMAADVDGSSTIDVSDYIGIANLITTGTIYGNKAQSRVSVRGIIER